VSAPLHHSRSRRPVAIRPYGPDDLEACARVFSRAWRAGHPYAPRDIDGATLRRETLGETILVAEEDGAAVGFVALYLPDRFVHHLYVDPDAQGRGVGRILLEEAVRLAGGAASLKCQTRNLGAIAFYRALGWTPGERGEGAFSSWVRMHSPAVTASS